MKKAKMICEAKNEIPASAIVSDICSSIGAPWVEMSGAIHHVCRRMGIAEAIAITKIVTAKNFAILPSRVAGNRSAFLALFQSNLFSISTRKANKNLDDQQRLREAAPAIKDFALRHRLRRSVTAKRLNCASLILLNIEDRGQPRHLEQVMHSLIQVCELQFPRLVANRCVSLNQLPDS